MIEMRVIHEGEGRFSPASHADWKTAIEEIEPRQELVARFVLPRSSQENRLLHGAIRSAYDNQRGGPMFGEEDGGWKRLRAWLLCEAGHCNTETFKPGSLSECAVIALKRRDIREGVHSFWSQHQRTGEIICRTPLTIKFAVVKHPDFQPIKTRMLDLMCNVIVPGTTPEQLMEIRYTRPRSKKAKTAPEGAENADH